LAEIVYKLKSSDPERLTRISEYLQKISPEIHAVEALSVDSNYSLRFNVKQAPGVYETFSAQNVSDGTLRALAVLVGLFQKNEHHPLSLIALKEPEAGVHPAAAGVLFDALMEASYNKQVVVTSHSPDLLDRNDIPENALRAVVMEQGETIIGDVDEAGKTVMRERLYTAGELLRMDQLRPEGISNLADVG